MCEKPLTWPDGTVGSCPKRLAAPLTAFYGEGRGRTTFFRWLWVMESLMDDLKTFCCQNVECPDYGRRGLGNLRVCFRNGPNKERRVLACRTCQHRSSERKRPALYSS